MKTFLKGIRREIALLRRREPGGRADPEAVIGTCQFCDKPVRYAEGDLDRHERARHDACLSRVMERQLSPLLAEGHFQRALAILRDLPLVRPHLRAAFDALPDSYGPIDMARLIDQMMPYAELEQALVRGERARTLLALRGIKKHVLGLGTAVAA